MARLRVRRNFRFSDLIDQRGSADVMREAGLRLAVKIENRTMSGLDERGRRFAPYSPAYRKGVKRGGVVRFASKSIGPVDLHLTGQMFRDFDVVQVTAKSVGLGFRGSESGKKADWHESGAGRLPVRKFLGVPDVWVADLVQFISRKLRIG